MAFRLRRILIFMGDELMTTAAACRCWGACKCRVWHKTQLPKFLSYYTMPKTYFAVLHAAPEIQAAVSLNKPHVIHHLSSVSCILICKLPSLCLFSSISDLFAEGKELKALEDRCRTAQWLKLDFCMSDSCSCSSPVSQLGICVFYCWSTVNRQHRLHHV